MATATITTLSLDLSSISIETEVDLTAHVTAPSASPPATPVGSVRFYETVYDLLVPVGPAVAVDNSGNAELSRFFTAGLHHLVAVFTATNPDAFATSTSTSHLLTVSSLGVSFGCLPGFALVASFSTQDDSSLPPAAVMQAIPPVLSVATQTGPDPETITLVWNTFNVPQIKILAGASDLTGTFPAGSTGSFQPPIITATTTYTLKAYDANGAPLIVGATQLQFSLTVKVL